MNTICSITYWKKKTKSQNETCDKNSNLDSLGLPLFRRDWDIEIEERDHVIAVDGRRRKPEIDGLQVISLFLQLSEKQEEEDDKIWIKENKGCVSGMVWNGEFGMSVLLASPHTHMLATSLSLSFFYYFFFFFFNWKRSPAIDLVPLSHVGASFSQFSCCRSWEAGSLLARPGYLHFEGSLSVCSPSVPLISKVSHLKVRWVIVEFEKVKAC